jgi:ATP-dependent DNA helicase RecG
MLSRPYHALVEQLELTLSFSKPGDAYTDADLALLTPDDIYLNASEALLRRLSEDRRIERKPATIHANELGEYLSMWANTMPSGGLIVVGQDDLGPFSGCLKINQGGLNLLEGCTFHCPNARVESKRVGVTRDDGESDFVLLIRVHYHQNMVVKHVNGHAYQRISDKKVTLSDFQIHELSVVKGEIDLERQPVSLAYPDEFNTAAIRQYVDSVVQHKGLGPHSDEEILTHTRLGTLTAGEFSPNVACALLFAKDPGIVLPGCKVRFLRHDGEEELTGKSYNVVKDLFIEGTVPEIIVATAQTLKHQLREFSTLGNDGRFYTAPEYPESAWYEAIVNACVHRSYVLKNMTVFVKMFDDKLIIESPGGFPPNVSPETIYNTHSPRNPHLMNALYYLKFVKAHNEGTRRMRDSMADSNLPTPVFEQKEVAAGFNSVRVTLRNNIKLRKLWLDSEVAAGLSAESMRGLGPLQMRVLNYVAEHGKINVTQTYKLGVAQRWQGAKKFLMAMVDLSLLEYHPGEVERDRRQCWTLPAK